MHEESASREGSPARRRRRFGLRLAILVVVACMVWFEPWFGEMATRWAVENNSLALWLARLVLLGIGAVLVVLVWWEEWGRRGARRARVATADD